MYQADEKRYEEMKYNRCGASGLLLPAVSLGLWHNFGSNGNFDNMQDMCHTAFDHGITHFDLANNYGPVPGSAEENFGRILAKGLGRYRDELIISTKAGYDMWPGPYGNWGSKKYLVASLDQSLKRMGLDYVDIFYHHRPDPNTPLEETVRALDGIVKSGKALYVGISNYNKEQTIAAAELFKELGTPFIINQRKYSMFVRDIEKDGLKDYAAAHGIGIITFSPLAQGLLTDRYLHGIPEDSRVRTDGRFLKEAAIVEETLKKVRALNDLASQRGQTLAQMALSWILKDGDITSVLIGASKSSQILDNIGIENFCIFVGFRQEDIDFLICGIADLLCLGASLCGIGRGDVFAFGDHALVHSGFVVAGQIQLFGFEGEQFDAVLLGGVPNVFHNGCRQLSVTTGDHIILSSTAYDIFRRVIYNGVQTALRVGDGRVQGLGKFQRIVDLP